MHTLLELLDEIRRLEAREALRFHTGFRTRRLSYRQLYARVGAFAAYLEGKGVGKGEHLLLWGENSPEWVAAFWACVARGVVVVPLDFHFSAALVGRIQKEVRARLLLHDERVRADAVEMEGLSFAALEKLPEPDAFQRAEVLPEDLVEIVYTSGTTGDPRGVVHRHRNLCANLRHFQLRIEPYKSRLRPIQPLRLLELLPLSHMFGQALGIFMPVLLEGAAVFVRELNARALVETLRRERISALVAVPRLAQNVQNEIARRFDLGPEELAAAAGLSLARRWWRFRRVHAACGWKFWFLVLGGARVDPEMERFWARLGFVVVQGYGLTEASPVVAVNHPFHARRGSLGKVIQGQEVRIAPDGEILVRGESVVTEYYGRRPEGDDKERWVHTGDIGALDAEGRLYYKGRKKEVIVTPEGFNVYPQDVEAVLERFAEVGECAVVGLPRGEEEEVHAVLVLHEARADVEALMRRANAQLEAHQRIRGWSLWPEEKLPRTPSTFKLKHREIVQRLLWRAEDPAGGGDLEAILARLSGREDSTLDEEEELARDLGLSSLEMMDLLSALEAHYGVALDEERFGRLATVGELKRWIGEVQRGGKKAPPSGEVQETVSGGRASPLPRWPQRRPARALRRLGRDGILLPLLRSYMALEVEGLEHLERLDPPLLFAANHLSALDAPAILMALPGEWRRRVAPAMTLRHFRAHFHPEDSPLAVRLSHGLKYGFLCGFFNIFPLPQGPAEVRRALQYMGELLDRGCCPLVFPEGRRSLDGRMQPFMPGIGAMAQHLQVPVLPIHLRGLFEVLPAHSTRPRRGPVRVRFGAALALEKTLDYAAAAREVEGAIKALAAPLTRSGC